MRLKKELRNRYQAWWIVKVEYKRFPAFYGTRRFITAFKRARPLFLFCARSIQSTPRPAFLKINYIIPETTHRFSKLCLSVRSLYQNAFMQFFFLLYMLHALPHLILHDLSTRIILGAAYSSWSSTLCSFLHSPVTPSLLTPNILLSTLFWNTLSYVPPSLWETKIHTHAKNRQNYISVYLNLYSFG